MAKMSFIIYFLKRVQYLLLGHHAQQYADAMDDSDKEKWLEAMNQEMESMYFCLGTCGSA